MRIGCLQFAPQVGDVKNNLNRADAVLSKAAPKDLDLLVLPEMAFSGYNFRTLQHISPYLEPTTSGISSLWARTTALKHNCVVMVGYPEKVDLTPKWPASPEYYNSAIVVNAQGETIANYRKSFLYYTDETWALEGPDRFYDGAIDGLGNVAIGICMDLNPYKFEAPWSAWEFSYHILHRQANLVVLSMAWLTRESARSYSRCFKDPDMDTLSYWLARLEPVIRAEGEEELIVVLANRSGTEEDAVYAGTSAVLGIQAGEVKVYGILGRGEKELLFVDTKKRPQAKLVSLAPSTASSTDSDTKRTSIKSPTLSEVSASSYLTVDTSSPDIGSFPQSMPEVISPLTPVDASTPHAYFASKGKDHELINFPHELNSSISDNAPEELFANTRSIITDEEINTLVDNTKTKFSHMPDTSINQLKSRVFEQNSSPATSSILPLDISSSLKSRNVSWTHQVDAKPSAAASRDLTNDAQEQKSSTVHSTAPKSTPFSRPASPKSRNASRTRRADEREPLESLSLPLVEQLSQLSLAQTPSPPLQTESRLQVTIDSQQAILHHPNLAKEEHIALSSSAPPCSVRLFASTPINTYMSSFSRNTFGARSQHINPRPRSSVW